MKNFVSLLFTVVITTIGLAQKEVKFQADIANRNSDVIFIKTTANKTIKEIKVNEKGIFQDSFEVTDGSYIMFDGKEYAQLFLKNGYDLKLEMDAAQFDESIVFNGKGADENNFLAQSELIDKKVNYDEMLSLSEDAFAKAVDNKLKLDIERLEKAKLDAKFKEDQKKSIEMNLRGLKQYYVNSKSNKN